MKDVWTQIEEPSKKISKKKIAIIIVATLLIIAAIATTITYKTNPEARNWIDKNVLRKEVRQDNVATIEVKEENVGSIYAFNKYIGILNKTKFKIYNGFGNEEKELDIQISNPIFNSEGRYLTIGEMKGKKVYLIEDKEIVWEDNIEGNISQIYVNRNGYVAVVIVNTSHKSVIKMYDPQGTMIFNTYLSTRVVDVSISTDNKEVAIAEVNTSGTIIQSNVKIISIEKAKKEENSPLENSYQSEAGKLITNIKYQNKNKLVCMYTDTISIIENGTVTEISNNDKKKITFQSIDLSNHTCTVEEKSSGLFTADSQVIITNTDNKAQKEYIADSVTKEIYTYGDIIALNLGTEVEFINTNGWLVKRYIANQEITKICVSDNLAGIIYRDKIEIINL